VSNLGRERAGVRVVILKEESPSCGLFRARIGANRRRAVQGAGVFGALSYLSRAYTHHAKRGTLDGVDLHDLTVRSPEVLRNATTIAAELTTLERITFENDLLFGSGPVPYRERGRVRARDEALERGATAERDDG